VRIPKLDRTYTNQKYGIRSGDMVFMRDDLKPFFDAQVRLSHVGDPAY
jgi:hypothetical protein